jgi:tetratricopeptide (TPR) repeat protein
MQLNITQLAKKAVSAALKSDWPSAIKANLEILDKDPSNLEAKLRLGRAYIYTKEPNKAKRMFKEVLAIDPINQVALKNLTILKEDTPMIVSESNVKTDSLIKEPGTSVETQLQITAKGIKAENLTPGEQFTTKLNKTSIELISCAGKSEIVVGVINDTDIASRLNSLTKLEGTFVVSYIKGKDKTITVLIKTSVPVFKSDKQDIRPYIKKGSLDEPDGEGEEMLELGE